MRHRIISGTGLGNPSPALLDNTGHVPKDFAGAAMSAYFPDGFDYSVGDDEISIGVEPAYQYQHLKIISINRKKAESYMQTGMAWGGYGSQIAKSTKFYKDYKYNSKFKKFIDEWHTKLFLEEK